MTLEELEREFEKAGGGPLAAPGVNPVFGEGDSRAQLLFLGEAPGFNENEQQRPFVGQAGKLLRKTLVENDWREDEVYITNIVKFRPPENRDPTTAEIEFFRPILDKQIEIIAPKIIVTLGRFSMFKFLGEGVSISRIHGQPRVVDWNGKETTVFPMYHPAAALRAGEVMAQFLADFKKLRDFVDGKANTIPEPAAEHKEEQPKTKQLGLI